MAKTEKGEKKVYVHEHKKKKPGATYKKVEEVVYYEFVNVAVVRNGSL